MSSQNAEASTSQNAYATTSQGADAITSQDPSTTNDRPSWIREMTEDKDGVITMKIPSAEVSAKELQDYLWKHYPAQCKVKLKKDRYKVKIDPRKNKGKGKAQGTS